MERARGGDIGGGGRRHPHPIYFSGALGWASFVALVATLLIRHNDLARSTDWAIVGCAVVAALCGFVGPATRWARTWVETEAATLRCTSGILWPSTVEVDLDRARALGVDRGLMGRWLGYGRLRIVDEAGTTHVFPPLGEAALGVAVTRRERQSRGRRGDRRDG